MNDKNCYLFLVDKNGKEYRAYSQPVSLKEMDTHTTKYNNKNELIETILNNTKAIMNPKDFIDILIYMKPNKDSEEYIKERGPLFKKDAKVLCEAATAGKFELLAMDKAFVLKFIKKYEKIPNFNLSVKTIENLINNYADYMEELQMLSEKIFSSYKGSRIAYLNMQNISKTSNKEENKQLEENKNHNYHIEPPKANPPKAISKRDSIEYQKVNKLGRKINELKYLKEYERELLDIEDFDHYKDISPFDEHKTK